MIRTWPFQAFRSPSRADGARVRQIVALAGSLHRESDATLARTTEDLRSEVAGGRSLLCDEVVVPALALMHEAVRRTTGCSCYDVQLLAGLTLAKKAIAEVQTGEGKTLIAAFPAFLRALGGHGVHTLTVNAYLAERDCERLRPAFELLGLSVGLLKAQTPPDEKRAAYRCDVTYGPGYEFGFDYLRDQVAGFRDPTRQLGASVRARLLGESLPLVTSTQRGHAFALVDEADSVMIDEATTPLLLAEPAPHATDERAHVMARDVAESLLPEVDFAALGSREVRLTDHGRDKIRAAGRVAAESGLNRPWPTYVTQALTARLFLRRDVDYVVRDGEVQIVDGNTGRIFADRSWRDGLHQAVQARERLDVTAETRGLARLARQAFFRLYDRLAGMTGTARDAAREFRGTYGLSVVTIPTHRPSRRVRQSPRFFGSAAAKWNAIADDVSSLHAAGRPVLVGTRTIEQSRVLADLFTERGLPFRLLNGVQDADEAALVATAGECGTITIATNMAGRGTDIRLGEGAAELGGLHVVGVEPNESLRVDRQLIGRAARQGDPGSYRFYASADDAILTEHAAPLTRELRRRAGTRGEVHGDYTTAVTRAQQRAERRRALIRQQLYAHDEWLAEVMERVGS